MRLFILTALVLAGIDAAEAQSEDNNEVDRLYGCAGITDANERLACFDRAVGDLRQAEDSGEIATITREEVDRDAEEKYGLRDAPSLMEETREDMARAAPDVESAAEPPTQDRGEVLRAEKPSRLTVAVTEFDETLTGELLVTLENGAIWEQIGGRKIRLSKRNWPDTVEIREASLGSYLMKVSNYPAIRVRRIR